MTMRGPTEEHELFLTWGLRPHTPGIYRFPPEWVLMRRIHPVPHLAAEHHTEQGNAHLQRGP
jgi:hypothetical protein